MRERDHKPCGAVCLNVIGRWRKDDSSGSPMIREIRPAHPERPLHAQGIPEHWITRLISARLTDQGLNAGPAGLRASVGSTEAANEVFARFGVIDV
jgi:hypothetical protein